MNTKQHGQIVLLFACMFGVSLAQTPQSDLESGGREAVNAFEGMPAVYGLESLHNGVLEENSLWSDGLENTGKKVCIHRDKLIVYSTAAMSDKGVPEPPKGNIAICLFNGRGFALRGNETHVLRMNMELIREMDPVYLRDLMTSNRSIEDIEEELNAVEGTTFLRGGLRINESSYSLLNTEFALSRDNATVIGADLAKLYQKPSHGKVMKPDTGDELAFAGHIKVTVSPSADGLIGKGELIMNSDEYSGKYAVLLHTEKPLPSDIMPAGGEIDKSGNLVRLSGDEEWPPGI